MNDNLEILIEEYKLVSTYVNTTAMGILKVMPVALTALTALVIYKQPSPALLGLGVAVAIFTLLAWVGYCHSLVHGYGLKLIEMEHRINQIGGLGDNGLSFQAWDVAPDPDKDNLPGFRGYTLLIGLAFTSILAAALCYFWLDSGWAWRWKVATIIGAVLLDFSPVWIMHKSGESTRRRRRQIMANW